MLVPGNSDAVSVRTAFVVFDSDNGRPVVAAIRALNDINSAASVFLVDANVFAVAIHSAAVEIVIAVAVLTTAQSIDRYALTANRQFDRIVNRSAPNYGLRFCFTEICDKKECRENRA